VSEVKNYQTLPLSDHEKLVSIIVEEVRRSLGQVNLPVETMPSFPPIPLGVSNRHIHLTEKTFHHLFGEQAQFREERPLYQPGEFASAHTLTIIGAKMRSIQNVRILGPLRNYDQVELTLTDAIQLGINAPVQNSGNLKGAAPLTLVGPKSSIYLPECALIASRHIHMTNAHAGLFGVKEGDFCRVKIAGVKSTIFENVLVRINDNWKLQMHLDTDDANAANVRGEVTAEFLGKMQVNQ
jgi:putative phosphotransacetylase